MNRCCCYPETAGATFNDKTAARQIKKYRKKGPAKSTRVLLDALKARMPDGSTLLDIGGGIGAIQHELLKAGVTRVTSVDASSAYLAAARAEAERQGHADRVSYHHGDFVELAPQIEQADIVTLDRVICCYHDMQSLVGLSAGRAARLYGAVYPRDTWLIRLAGTLGNFILWVTRNPFRSFVHPTQAIEKVLRDNGLGKTFQRNVGPVWQVAVFSRSGVP